MKSILSVLSLVFISTWSFAQIPKYQFTNYPQPPGSSLYGFGLNRDDAGRKLQCIFYPSNFPAVPKGIVKAVYLRVTRNPVTTPSTYTYTNVKVRMGYTNDSTFPKNPDKIDTFKTGLHLVYSTNNFTISNADSQGFWVKIPLANDSFFYTPERKFVFEISRGAKSDGNKGWPIMASHTAITANKFRTLEAHPDSMRAINTGSPSIIDFGMDLATTGVENVTNVTSFGLFPNPSTDGHFVVSFEATKAVKEVVVSVMNTTGQQVFQKSFSGVGNTFFNEMVLPEVAKGVYFVEMRAGEDRIVRQIIVQ